jgi:hypothetical protein
VIRLSALLSAVLLVCAVPATAQLSPSTSGFSTAPTAANDEEYFYMLRQLGPCLADGRRGRAIAFLDAPIDSSEEDAAFAALFDDAINPCLRNFVSASLVRSWVRGVVAEGLFKDALRKWPEGAVPATEEPGSIASIHDFARCYVANDFAAARSLLEDTRLGDKSELARMRELAPTFGQCLPEGSNVTLKPMNIRMALAEALYHATRDPSTARAPGEAG